MTAGPVPPPPDRRRTVTPALEDRAFLILLTAASLAFAWVLLPMFGAILWSLIATILFAPLNARLLRRMPARRNSAAFLVLLLVVALVILPAIMLAIAVIEQLAGLYEQLRSGQIDLARYFAQFQHALPGWARRLLFQAGLTDLDAVRERLAAGFMRSFETVARQALNVGQSAFSFVVAVGVMLYLTFFLLRDGEGLQRQLAQAAPLRQEQWQGLAERFATVVRATIKGSIIVGIAQGAIGGTVFWALGIPAALLWGVLMAFLSLLPAIGTGIVWVPVALFLLVSGAVAKGLILVFCGLFVIGMVDNILRPILVGRDTRIPDWLVLLTTLGGLEVFGFNGIVIGPVIAAMFMAAWAIFARWRPALEEEGIEEEGIVRD